MLFGLTNAPASFQALINNTLCPCLDRFACAYLDDIVVYSKILREHIEHVQEVLGRLCICWLFVQKDKCEFHKTVIKFLGFIIRREFIQMDLKKVASVASLLEPTCLKHLQAFLGCANFYRQFIKNYSQRALSMTKLLKDTTFQWNNEAQTSFETLKRAFTNRSILQHFKQGVGTTLETNALDGAIKGCLSQVDNAGVLCLVVFYSSKLAKVEQNYEIYNKKMLAIVVCLLE